MKELFQYLNFIFPMSQELCEHLSGILKSKTFHKKDLLLRAGNVSNKIFFIESGLVRCFYDMHDKEVCSWFMKEGDVIISVESFFKQVPSYENIQSLEETQIHFIYFSQLQYIYQNFPEFNFIGRVLLEKYYSLSEQRLYSLRMQTASERYNYLMQNFPEIIQRVPSKYIASYLGIAVETLSRSKKL